MLITTRPIWPSSSCPAAQSVLAQARPGRPRCRLGRCECTRPLALAGGNTPDSICLVRQRATGAITDWSSFTDGGQLPPPLRVGDSLVLQPVQGREPDVAGRRPNPADSRCSSWTCRTRLCILGSRAGEFPGLTAKPARSGGTGRDSASAWPPRPRLSGGYVCSDRLVLIVSLRGLPALGRRCRDARLGRARGRSSGRGRVADEYYGLPNPTANSGRPSTARQATHSGCWRMPQAPAADPVPDGRCRGPRPRHLVHAHWVTGCTRDRPTAIALGPAGVVCVSGTSGTAACWDDRVTVKYVQGGSSVERGAPLICTLGGCRPIVQRHELGQRHLPVPAAGR